MEELEEETQKSITMASFVPNQVIYNACDYSLQKLEGAILFGDVSGFTDLCRKYTETGHGGPSRMTSVLNNYIGEMVQEIMRHNGDVLKFSGDAFLALWKVSEHFSIKDAVHEALDCALIIQKNYGTYKTDVGVTIRVKLVISSGHCVFGLMGDEEHSHYLCIGNCIRENKDAEDFTFPGDIVITTKSWRNVGLNEYLSQALKGGQFYKVLGMGPNWRSSLKTRTVIQKGSSLSCLQDEYSMRPAVNFVIRNNLAANLRKFILKPVLSGIDMNQPLEHLTEMRQIVVLFMNIIIEDKLSYKSILQLGQQAYKITCSLAKPLNGCVNKANNFDKDLLILILFGLRGFKHEMESQAALRCAQLCVKELSGLKNVESISIGVTTGDTYCGVFGHSLRREYTAISLKVNLAARLMCAYPNKITCDRETFLQSKLDPSCFTLQEFRPFKGIEKPGAIYEFHDQQVSKELSSTVSSYPILGRDDEITLFLKVLSTKKPLIFQGGARAGKTRLLEELTFLTPQDFSCFRVVLKQQDFPISFTTIRLVVYPAMGLNEDSTLKQKEDKLSRRTDFLKLPETLCFFNEIFAVKFPVSEWFSSMNSEAKLEIGKKLFKQLLSSIFVATSWAIFVDNLEFADKESWDLLQIMFQLNLVSFVATLGCRRNLCENAETIISQKSDSQVVTLKEIGKWYRIGIACQMLNVQGLPAEIERILIQHCCGGVPGWIENFLISLLQENNVEITKMSRESALEKGLVLAPLYMLTRLNKKDVVLYQNILEESTTENSHWKIYVDSCRENFGRVKNLIESSFQVNTSITVCLLTPLFNAEDVKTESSAYAELLAIFDSLNSNEQLVLKCGSILGEQFERTKLMYVMGSTGTVNLTSSAVKKLFELQVFTCAKGDFIEGNLNVGVEKRRKEVIGVQCECVGLFISDVPKYAYCGYMRFKNSKYREATYNLLTDNQKKEFHTRAIRFLEKETRKCRACGNGHFESNQDKADVSFSVPVAGKTRESNWSSRDTSVVYSTTENGGSTSESVKTKVSRGKSGVSAAAYAFASNSLKLWRLEENLMKTYSNSDFSLCQCNLILNSLYSHLIVHCRGTGDDVKLLESMTSYAYICLESQNFFQCRKIMEDALQVIDSMTFDSQWDKEMKQGKVYTMLGNCFLRREQWSYGHDFLIRGLKLYGLHFPRSKFWTAVLSSYLMLRQRISLFFFNGLKNTGRHSDFYNALSENLGLLCNYFVVQQDWKSAFLAAIWSLDKALSALNDFNTLCQAFKNTILVLHHFGNKTTINDVIVFSLKLCHLKATYMTLTEMKVVAELYLTIFQVRLFAGQLEHCIEIGYILRRICFSARLYDVLLEVFHTLFGVFLSTLRLVESVSILDEMQSNVELYLDNENLIWYYCCCLKFQLYTGAAVVSIEEIQRFYADVVANENSDAAYRFKVLLWLWYLRRQRFELTYLFRIPVWGYDLTMSATWCRVDSWMHALEATLLYFVWKLDQKSLFKAKRAQSIIDDLFKFLKKEAKILPVINSRLKHLQAYYHIILENDFLGSFKMLQAAEEVASQFGDCLEVAWIQHNGLAWKNALNDFEINAWKLEERDYSQLEIDGKILHFTLPLPVFL